MLSLRIKSALFALILCFPLILMGQDKEHNDKIGPHSAVALNKFTLYEKADFTAHSNIVVKENTLLEIIWTSPELDYDTYQNQKFKWYKVNTFDGKQGYVFGDNIAVYEMDAHADQRISELHNSNRSFAPNYKNADIWLASLKGIDAEDHGSADYLETYLVITNNFGHSSFIRIGNKRAEGEIKADYIEFRDITTDGYEEIILQTSAVTLEKQFPTKYLEIFSFQSRNLESVLHERMNVETYPSKTAPALEKHFEIEDNFLRVSYIDYVDCQKYCCAQDLKNTESNVFACMEHVTYSYTVSYTHLTLPTILLV